ncbi:MAG: tetratricopeptide repeat protein [Cyanobacteria bacterium P01_D01_bin.105]
MTATQPTSRQLKSRQLLGVNQQTYQSLKASLSLDLRRQLLIAVCDSVEMQEQIATQLERDISEQAERSVAANAVELSKQGIKPIERLIFDADDGNLPQQIANWMRHTLFTVGDLPQLQLLGIEQMTRQPAITQNYFLRSLDKIEALLPRLNTNLLVWVPWPWLRTIQQSSPTFWNWRNGVYEFVSDPTPAPTSREALNIDISMFEPEHSPEWEPESESPQSSDEPLHDFDAPPQDFTQDFTQDFVDALTTAKLNGSATVANQYTNGHSDSADPKLANHSASPDSASPDSASPDSASPDSASPDSASPDSASSDSASSDAASTTANSQIESSAVQNGHTPQKADLPQSFAETIEAAIIAEADVLELDEATDEAFAEFDSEAAGNQIMPLEFWEEDDFPIFDNTLESNREESTSPEGSAAEGDVEESDLEAIDIDALLSLNSPEIETPGIETPIPEMPDRDPTEAEPALEAEPTTEAEPVLEAEPLSLEELVLLEDPVSSDIPENEPTTSESTHLDTSASETDIPENVTSPTASENIKDTTDELSFINNAEKTNSENTTEQQQPNRQRKEHLRNIFALGGLHSNVSQGINSTSSVNGTSANSDSSVENLDLDTLSNLFEQDDSALEAQSLLFEEDDPDVLLQTLLDDHTANESNTNESNTNESNTNSVSVETAVLSQKDTVSELKTTVLEAPEPALPQQGKAEPTVTAEMADEQPPQLPPSELTPSELPSSELPPSKALEQAGTKESLDKGLHTPKGNQERDAKKAAEYFAEGLRYRNRIETGERSLEVIEAAIAAYENGLTCLSDSHPDWITGLNDLGTLYWLKAQQSDQAQAIAYMEQSIQLYQQALDRSDHDSTARSQGTPAGITGQLYSNMGAVLTMLATHQQPVDYLTQAAENYQKALPLVSLRTEPEEYATLQNSLGSVFWKLSHYESAGQNLNEAIAAYSEALRGYRTDQNPLDYAAVQNNLGITYWSLAKHEHPENLLKQAITAYRDALNYRTSDVDPAACAISYNNLALAYWDLSKYTHKAIKQKSRYQKNAVTAFEAALNINNLSGALSPMDSAAIYHCLGDVHAQMSETATSPADISDSLQKSLYSYVKSIEDLPTDSPAYPPRFGAIVANLRLHYDKLGLEGQQAALNRIPAPLLPQVMMAL